MLISLSGSQQVCQFALRRWLLEMSRLDIVLSSECVVEWLDQRRKVKGGIDCKVNAF
jgi:hypothetical protein